MTFLSRKRKKYKFAVVLHLDELSSVPFINGLLYAKIRLLQGGSFQTTSHRQEVQDHSVKWGERFEFSCKMSANASDGVLDSVMLRISVRKEVQGGRSSQKLGFVDLDLAEFAGAGPSSKRYLLEGYNNQHHRQDNSTLKIKIETTLLSGDPLFKRPTTSSFYTPLYSSDTQLALPIEPEPAAQPGDATKLTDMAANIVDDIVASSIKADHQEDPDGVGMQIYIGRDGTATLGSRSGTNPRKKKIPADNKEEITIFNSQERRESSLQGIDDAVQ